ncbi:hypothetical protein BU15DRAFT_67102 [Melanogaster broomeanus]|nr:hypothetical protein BU15DRAFT_67102 [Melanogaster broomeanus]
MPQVTKCHSPALQAQFQLVQVARWGTQKLDSIRGSANLGSNENAFSCSQKQDLRNAPALSTCSQQAGVLRVALSEVQNELHSTKLLLAECLDEAKRQASEFSLQAATLAETQEALQCTKEDLQAMHVTLNATYDQLTATAAASQHWHSLLHLERRKCKPWQRKATGLRERVKELKMVLIPHLRDGFDARMRVLQYRIDDLEKGAAGREETVRKLQENVQTCRRQMRKHQMKALCTSRRLAQTIARHRSAKCALSAISCHTLDRKNGAYSSQFHAIARSLVLVGCARVSVGSVLKLVGAAFGVTVPKCMNWRTVGQVMLEGGLASQIQVTHEIATTDAVTLSSDSTSHRHVDFTSRHVALKSPDGQGHVVRLLGVDSSIDHKASTQVREWKDKLSSLNFMEKLKGVNGDHSSDQLKSFDGLTDWKLNNMYIRLGTQAASQAVQQTGHASPVPALKFPSTLPHDSDSSDPGVIQMFGMQAFEALPKDEQRCLPLIANGLEHPLLLANRDNAAMLRERSGGGPGEVPVTAAEICAVEVSGHGGVKAASLTGAIFNHKDDKKGVHDMHCQYFESIKGHGRSVTFPNTSNIHYQSYCDAAEELLTYLDEYIKLLLQIRYKKEKRNFSHMEENLFNALHDALTLTELAVLVWYAATIGHPYMYYVRGEGTKETSILDLGPLHDRLKVHIQNIVDNPDLLLAEDTYSRMATLDGSDWHIPTAVVAVQQLAKDGQLPHLCTGLIAFFHGALTVWNCLTPEFESGSACATMTATERADAWMPTTNDWNEGALGAYRVRAHQKPTLTLHQYNAEALYRHNNTDAFVSSSCTSMEHQWLMAKACEVDSSGLEAERRKLLKENMECIADERQQKEAEREAVLAKEKTRIDAISLILDNNSLDRLTRVQLDDQLAIHRCQDSSIKVKSHYKNKQEKLAAVKAAVLIVLHSHSSDQSVSVVTPPNDVMSSAPFRSCAVEPDLDLVSRQPEDDIKDEY